jgi:hypothetical protein
LEQGGSINGNNGMRRSEGALGGVVLSSSVKRSDHRQKIAGTVQN